LTLVKYHVLELKSMTSVLETKRSNNKSIKWWCYWWIPWIQNLVFIGRSHQELEASSLLLTI